MHQNDRFESSNTCLSIDVESRTLSYVYPEIIFQNVPASIRPFLRDAGNWSMFGGVYFSLFSQIFAGSGGICIYNITLTMSG
jgi:hypothetical protein